MMGVWKAGMTYVPINPEFVKVQLTHILEDAKISAILVHSDTESNVRVLLSGTHFKHLPPSLANYLQRRTYA